LTRSLFSFSQLRKPGTDFKFAQDIGDMAAACWSHFETRPLHFHLARQSGILVPVVTFYLLRDWDLLVAGFAICCPGASNR
jgi:hypothetical protein